MKRSLREAGSVMHFGEKIAGIDRHELSETTAPLNYPVVRRNAHQPEVRRTPAEPLGSRAPNP